MSETPRTVKLVAPPGLMSRVVAANVRSLRAQRGLTQSQVSVRTMKAAALLGQKRGLGQAVLSALESEERSVRVDDLPLLCHALEVGVDELLSLPGSMDEGLYEALDGALFPARRTSAPLTYGTLADGEATLKWALQLLSPEIDKAVNRALNERLNRLTGDTDA